MPVNLFPCAMIAPQKRSNLESMRAMKTNKKILVGCEKFGRVREAFNQYHGVRAVSCDTEPAADGMVDYHIQDDVLNHLDDGWDAGIFFPPCTFLTSANTYISRGCSKYTAEEGKELQRKAIEFFMSLVNSKIPKKAIENPVGIMSSIYRKPDQIIQPWMFGEDASKKTCLWLFGLPKLKPTKIIPPKGYQLVKFAMDLPLCPCCEEEAYCPEHQCHFADCDCIGPTQDDIYYRTVDGYLFGTMTEGLRPVWANQTPSGQNKLGPSDDRADLRGMTYLGVAKAMTQWVKSIDKPPE